MTAKARKTAPVLLVVAVILAILATLYIIFGQLHRERLEDIAKNQGDTELARAIRTEAAAYARQNRNEQRIILVVGAVSIAVTATWWTSGREREE